MKVFFHIPGTETWEKLSVPGLKPQPRAESVALAVSELLLRGSCVDHPKARFRSQRPRLSSNRISPSEAPTRPSFLKEISKLSQINLSRLSHPTKCSYSVLSGQDDNEESPKDVSIKIIFPSIVNQLTQKYSGENSWELHSHSSRRLQDFESRLQCFSDRFINYICKQSEAEIWIFQQILISYRVY